jgi:hypothetical protein
LWHLGVGRASVHTNKITSSGHNLIWGELEATLSQRQSTQALIEVLGAEKRQQYKATQMVRSFLFLFLAKLTYPAWTVCVAGPLAELVEVGSSCEVGDVVD